MITSLPLCSCFWLEFRLSTNSLVSRFVPDAHSALPWPPPWAKRSHEPAGKRFHFIFSFSVLRDLPAAIIPGESTSQIFLSFMFELRLTGIEI